MQTKITAGEYNKINIKISLQVGCSGLSLSMEVRYCFLLPVFNSADDRSRAELFPSYASDRQTDTEKYTRVVTVPSIPAR